MAGGFLFPRHVPTVMNDGQRDGDEEVDVGGVVVAVDERAEEEGTALAQAEHQDSTGEPLR